MDQNGSFPPFPFNYYQDQQMEQYQMFPPGYMPVYPTLLELSSNEQSATLDQYTSVDQHLYHEDQSEEEDEEEELATAAATAAATTTTLTTNNPTSKKGKQAIKPAKSSKKGTKDPEYRACKQRSERKREKKLCVLHDFIDKIAGNDETNFEDAGVAKAAKEEMEKRGIAEDVIAAVVAAMEKSVNDHFDEAVEDARKRKGQ